MKRKLTRLANNTYDVLVIGGGIHGACVAWDATLRGLSVALVEKADFNSATSANSLKVIHGGIRYLQHADFRRMRQSITERTNLMSIAPHLVHPLPVLIPSYRHWTQRKELSLLALKINDLIGFDRNRLDDPQKNIPGGQVISKKEVLNLFPFIEQEDLTGGMLFYDAQVYNSERLVISFLRSAEASGADIANYVKVTGLLKTNDNVNGVEVSDALTGDRFDIRANAVVNTSGPWIGDVFGDQGVSKSVRKVAFAKAVNIITRPFSQSHAVGIASKKTFVDADAKINKGSRFLFVTPWRGRSIVGTGYSPYDGNPDVFKVTEQDINSLLEDVNDAWPDAKLSMEDVDFVHGGLLPSSGISSETGDVQLTKHYKIHDHHSDGAKGLLSVISVKYTTARYVAEKVVDQVFRTRGQRPPRSKTAFTPLYGGEIKRFEDFLSTAMSERAYSLGEQTVRQMVMNYGSAYPQVLEHMTDGINKRPTESDELPVLKAEVLHGVREEMAQKLSDVVFRRTELGSAGHPGREALRVCADAMSTELNWDARRTDEELREVEERYLFSGVKI